MKIHKEGYLISLISLKVAVILALIVHFYINFNPYFSALLYASIATFLFLSIRFFRIPNRDIIIDENAIYSPADGKVVVIEETMENEYFKDMRKQISIFMSPLNVHVNYAPISGKIVYKKYNPGRFLVAWLPKSSTLNESHSIVISNPKGDILVKQIAGAVARRIVCNATENQEITQGDEFGLIKYGSRLDVYLPLDAQVEVELEQKVKTKKTVIARFE